MADEPNYEKPTSLIDLEARQEEDYVPPGVVGRTSDPQRSENGYVAVDPIYQNYADETHKPGFPEEGAEAKVWETFVSDDVDTSIGATPEDEAEGREQRESDVTYTADGAAVSASRPTVSESQEQWDEGHAGDYPPDQTTPAQDSTPKGQASDPEDAPPEAKARKQSQSSSTPSQSTTHPSTS